MYSFPCFKIEFTCASGLKLSKETSSTSLLEEDKVNTVFYSTHISKKTERLRQIECEFSVKDVHFKQQSTFSVFT